VIHTPLRRSAAAVSLFGLLGSGCHSAPPPAPPPSEVSVVTVEPRTVDQLYEFVGNVSASKRVEVRARVDGVILARPFTEGQAVTAGQLLYRIDPTTYDADWRGAKARLTEAQARLANAEANAARYQSLLADHAVARQDYDNAETEVKQARAAVEDAQATIDRTRKDLNDTEVRAELAGRVGRTNLEVGARVRGTDDVLTTIDVLDPIYVTFQPSAQQLLAWHRDPRASRMLRPGGAVRVQAVLPDGSTAPTEGRIGFIDPVLDPSTGTQTFRAEFRNPNRLLLPGQFVRVRLLGLMRDSAILVPQRAVLQQLGRQVVYVVGAGDTVQARDVTATGWSGDQWLIDHGLAPGDRVVVDGVQKTGPGRVVRPVPLADTTTSTARAGGATPEGASK
jgi:membrane fusion protein, multidrug efflux system